MEKTITMKKAEPKLSDEQIAWLTARAKKLHGSIEAAAASTSVAFQTFYKSITGRSTPSVVTGREIERALKIERFPVHGEKIIPLKMTKLGGKRIHS